MNFPDHIQGLVKAQNASDSAAFATYFTENAIVSDEGASYSGRAEIKKWIEKAAEKYTMELKPLDYDQSGSSGRLTVEVTGSFPGSPAVMEYHLEFAGTSIDSLKITG